MEQPLRSGELDRHLAELEAYAVEVFGDSEAASHWIDTGLWELDDLSPRKAVIREGAVGLERGRNVLLRIEYGVYS